MNTENILNLIKKYPNHNWNWENISSTINLSNIETFEMYIDKWDISKVSQNPTLSHTILTKYKNKDWNWEFISLNIKITIELFEEFISFWDILVLSRNENLTFNIVEKYEDKNWVWFWLSKNQNINMYILEKYNSKIYWYTLPYSNIYLSDEFIDKYSDKIFLTYALQYSKCVNKYINNIQNLYYALQNPHIDFEYIRTVILNFSRNELEGLGRNPKLTFQFVEEFINLNWNFNYLSMREDLDINFVEKYSDKEWNWSIICKTYKIDENFLEKYENKICWYSLSRNACLTLNIINRYPDKDWNWTFISKRSIVNKEEMLNNFKRYNPFHLIFNPNIDLEIIKTLRIHYLYQYSYNRNIDLEIVEYIVSNNLEIDMRKLCCINDKKSKRLYIKDKTSYKLNIDLSETPLYCFLQDVLYDENYIF